MPVDVVTTSTIGRPRAERRLRLRPGPRDGLVREYRVGGVGGADLHRLKEILETD